MEVIPRCTEHLVTRTNESQKVKAEEVSRAMDTNTMIVTITWIIVLGLLLMMYLYVILKDIQQQ